MLEEKLNDDTLTAKEIKVLKNVSKLEIEATPNDSKATVKVTNPENLEIGENSVKIEVTNDGNLKTYNVKVIKLDEEDTKLANLNSLKIVDTIKENM